MIHTLYKTTNNKNDKFYIGVHSTDDVGFGTDTWVDDYVGSGKGISRALKKYGRESFNVEIIAYFDNEDYAYDAERDLVTEEWLTTNRDRTYNMTPGGNRPPKATSETGKKAYATRRMNGNSNDGFRNPMKQPSARAKSSATKTGKPGKHYPYSPEGRQAVIAYGKSAKWFNNGIVQVKVPEGKQPEGFVPGRIISPKALASLRTSVKNAQQHAKRNPINGRFTGAL